MDLQQYKHLLLDLEKTLALRTGRAVEEGQQEFLGSAHDLGEASMADEVASERFTEAQADSSTLQQVRDALHRIAQGTFGTCVVDGEPIEDKRLEAVPWTPYCLKHAEGREAGSARTPTM